MMKKNITFKSITCSLVLVALMSATAFAATQPAATPDKADTTAAVEKAAESEAKNMLVSGKVTDIVSDKDAATITITNDDMGMVFHVSKNVFVIDKKTNSYLSVSDIKKDMTITAVIDKMAPMTMSLPPQTGGAIGFILNSDQGSADLSTYNDELVNFENTLKLNIDKKTQIVDVKGTKKLFGAEDLKGSECLVLYTVSTRSIPAQTAPEFVMILNTTEQLDQDGSTDNSEKATYVALRELAEAKGYQVKWESASKPVVLTKDDIRIELTIGSTEFAFEHKTKDIKPLDKMDKLDLAVKLENGKTMVPNTFIEAL